MNYFTKLPGRGRMSICPDERWGGEFEWLKSLQGPLLENCRKLLSLWVRKPEKKFKQHLHHHMLVGRVSIKNYPSSSKNKLQHIQLSDKLELQIWLASMVSFLAENTQDEFGEDRDKIHPMCTMQYTAVFFVMLAYISAGGPGHLF